MSARGPKRNNVLAGLFLVSSLVVAVVLSFWVADIFDRFGSFTTYAVNLSLKDGATGIEPGSPVRLGGKTVGRVESVAWAHGPKLPDGRAVTTGIRVKIKIRADVPLYADAITQIERPILGGLAAINITNPGGMTSPERPDASPAELLAEGGTIHGILAPGLLTQAGLGPEQIEQIRGIITQLNAASTDIATITGAFAPGAEPAMGDVAELLKSARRVVEAAESDFDELWSPKVTSTLDNFDEISANGVEISESVASGVDEARQGIDDAKAMIKSGQEIVDNAKPDIDSILKSVDEATRHFKEQTTVDIDELMARAKDTVAEYETLGNKANVFLEEQKPQVEETLANVRLASMDGRLFVAELRAQPQRLLRPPNKKELERELLYSSARAYAAAASDLRAASTALDNILHMAVDGDAPSLTPAEIIALQKKVHNAFETYQDAETDLLDAIIGDAPSP
jgi:ABC-type transporter Mla subunit MlaD